MKNMITISIFAFTACGDQIDQHYYGPDYEAGAPAGSTSALPTGSNASVTDQIVGGWSGAAVCVNGQGDQATFEYYWFLCPNGNMKGASVIDTEYYFEMIDEGTYDVSEAAAEVTASYWSTVVNPSEIRGDSDYMTQRLDYDASSDTLTFTTLCPVTMQRASGNATNADCE